MKPIKIMINGIPGNMSTVIAKHAINDQRFDVLPYSLTGPEIHVPHHQVDTHVFNLIRPEERGGKIKAIAKSEVPLIIIDYTHPSAVNSNAEFYCKNHLDFVMGTTGGDRELLNRMVEASDVCAVIAPNMAKEIVGFQAMVDYAAKTFPGLFENYSLSIKESHQNGKADTSGTAKAMVKYFNKLGVPFSEDAIIKERNPENQVKQWGIPQEYLMGHGWHTYTLISKDGTVRFEFIHNINGRDVYVNGTLDAVCYLFEKTKNNKKGTVFSMIDVLKKNN